MNKFQDTAKEIADLVTEKNKSYGDSFGQSGKVLAILFPNGVSVDQYDDFLAITRIVDKLFRIANHKDAFSESPWRDICGYGLNAASRSQAEEKPGLEYVIHILNAGASSDGYADYLGNGYFNYFGVTKSLASRFSKVAAEQAVIECKQANGSYYTYTIEPV